MVRVIAVRTMYDSVTPATIPASATMVAGYVDGLYANLAAMRARFPFARIVSIAIRHTTRAQVLDVETGDATPAQAVVWCTQTMHDVPNGELTVYCNTSTWPAVRSAFAAAGVREPNYWVAQYDDVASIPAGAVAKQYADPGPYDLSAVADYWPGVDPAPVHAPPEADVPCYPFTVASAGGVHFARGSARNVSFFTDNTRAGQPAAQLRVVIWASGAAPEVHTVAVSNAGGNETTIPFANPAMTHSVTVERADGSTVPVYAEVS